MELTRVLVANGHLYPFMADRKRGHAGLRCCFPRHTLTWGSWKRLWKPQKVPKKKKRVHSLNNLERDVYIYIYYFTERKSMMLWLQGWCHHNWAFSIYHSSEGFPVNLEVIYLIHPPTVSLPYRVIKVQFLFVHKYSCELSEIKTISSQVSCLTHIK